ncbi:hypothetical protein [Deinococcus sonorensis]|uniref:Uncharacterized protein n=2 Tax=Deinococcus sonorensis TaxID=309891 RepID=A0AAU7UFW6_9DEIO
MPEVTGTEQAADPNRFSAEFGGSPLSGRITALEGNGGYMRVQFNASGPAEIAVGEEGVLELHDGARFRVAVVEALPDQESGSYRVKLVGRG